MEESLVKRVEESSERRGEEVVGAGSTVEWRGHGIIGMRSRGREGGKEERRRSREEKREKERDEVVWRGEQNRLEQPSMDTNWRHCSIVYTPALPYST